MKTLPFASGSAVSGARTGRSVLSHVRVMVGATVLFIAASTSLLAQNTAPASGDANRRRGGGQDDPNGGRGGFSAEDMLARLRERFEVTDDEEWKLISDRLKVVTELRRSTMGGGPGGPGGGFGRGGPPGGGGGGDAASRANRTGGRGPGGGSAEMTALTNAVRDKLPDAEIKSRLDRVRELRRENELKLAKAQEELRAVLSVRQEATAVVFGLLP